MTEEQFYRMFDTNIDGRFDTDDLERIAARDNDDPNLDDTIITLHEIETVLRDFVIMENGGS